MSDDDKTKTDEVAEEAAEDKEADEKQIGRASCRERV